MKRKYKILYGLEAADGGSLKHLCYLVSHLDKTLFDVTVIISDKRSSRVYGDIRKMRHEGVRVIILPMSRAIHPIHDIASFWKIHRHLRSEKYDIIHAHSSKAGILFRIAGRIQETACIIYTPHCFFFQGKTGLQRLIYRLIEKVMTMITDYIVVSNNELYAAINGKVAKPEKLVNINNAVKLNEYPSPFANRDLRKRFHIEDDIIVVGAAGRLTRQKDWPTFIRAAGKTIEVIDKVIFLIIGEGEQLANIEALIQRMGLKEKIIVTGYCEDMPGMYSLIDIFINTSLWEGLPYVLLEAMSNKKPIIATNLNYGEIIEDKKTGYLVECRDYEIISKKIIHLIENNALRKDMGKKGYYLSKKYLSFRKFICRHQELYIKTVHEKEDPLHLQ